MTLLFDTQLLIWGMRDPEKLPDEARGLLEDGAQSIHFSVVSIWEVAIKTGLRRASFQIDPAFFRRHMLENGLIELPIKGEHAAAVHSLPPLHNDPFDRMLIAQAIVENFTLISTDRDISRYNGPIRRV